VRTLDLGEAILLPGLVNTHAHLELTALRGAVRERPFPDWVRSVRAARESLEPRALRASARRGVLEHFAAGITTIGDTGSSGEGARAMAALGARGVAYQEVFGPDPARRETALGELDTALATILPLRSTLLTIGVSPHAPYTVSAPLLESVCRSANERRLPVAMHLAESPEEHELMSSGTGLFADRLRARDIAVTPWGLSPVAWAMKHGLAIQPPLCIHCVRVDKTDIHSLATARAAVAHCPWSNALLGNGRAPLAALLAGGVRLGLGTDSVVTGGATDLFAELRLACRDNRISPREALGLVTTGAAAALGLPDVGVLHPGAWADLTAVRLYAPTTDPEATLVARAMASDVSGTWVAGRAVYRAGAWPGADAAAEFLDA
jgi:5-methylthioadenosine/S-adenosylhomocysteine deaminase